MFVWKCKVYLHNSVATKSMSGLHLLFLCNFLSFIYKALNKDMIYNTLVNSYWIDKGWIHITLAYTNTMTINWWAVFYSPFYFLFYFPEAIISYNNKPLGFATDTLETCKMCFVEKTVWTVTVWFAYMTSPVKYGLHFKQLDKKRDEYEFKKKTFT